MLSRRAALRMVVLSASGALLAACSSAPQPAPPPTASTTGSTPAAAAKPAASSATAAPAAAQKPKTGGTLRVGMVGDIISLDGFVWSPNNSNTIGQIYDQLITYDEKLTPQPRLAESWELSSDNKTIKFNLRKGVQFHDGREFTSDDVKYSLLRAKDPKTVYNATVGPGAAFWTGIDTPDKYSIVLTSDLPRPGAFDSILYLRILDKEVMEGPDAKTKANGTSAFKLLEWVPGDHITLEKNPNYWESGLPYLDQVSIKVFKDQPGMVVALEAGSLDMAFAPSIQDAGRLKSDPKYQVFTNHALGQYFYMQLNAAVPPTDNKLLRQAIASTINRQRFTDSIMTGFTGDPQDLPWPNQSAAWELSKNAYYTFDLDKAKSLVARSGIASPEFDLSYPLASFAGEYGSLAQIIQADLAQIGVKTTLKPLEIAAFTAAGQGTNPPYNGVRLNAAAFTNVSEPTSHFILSSTFGVAINASGFYDDQYKALVTSASTEPDPAKRKLVYAKINDYILDAAYCLPISQYPNIMIEASNVRDLAYYPVLQWTLRTTWLS